MLARMVYMFDDIVVKTYILFGILTCYTDIQHVFCCNINSDDIVKNGNTCYYFSSDEKTRSEATSFCARSCGGNLVVDNDKNMRKNLTDRTRRNSSKEYWIGLSRGSKYYWTSQGGTIEINIGGNDTDGPCVVSNNGEWTYSNCNEKRRYVCKTGVDADGTCLQYWTRNGNHCYFLSSQIDKSENYVDARGYCDGKQSHLVTIADDAENNYLNSTKEESFWLGLSAYTWDNNETLSWETWNTLGNMGVGDCVFLQTTYWHSAPCENEKHFICEIQCDRSGFTTAVKPASSTFKSTTTDLSTSSTSTSKSTTKYTPPSSVPTVAQTQSSSISSGSIISSHPPKSQTTFHDTFTTNMLHYESESPSTTQSVSMERTSISSNPPIERTDKIISPEREVNTVLIGSVVGTAGVVILVVLLVVIIYRRKRQRKKQSNKKGDYDASYEIAFSPNTEDKTRNSDNSLTDDEKLAQLRNRDSRVVIDSNVPDSEKIKPYLVTTIVDGHSEGPPSRRSKVVSSIEDRVEYDNNNLDDLIVTDNDLYHSSRSDSYRSNVRHEPTDYDYAAHPPNRSQLSQGNVFINNAYDGEAEGGVVNDIQGAQIHYADIAFSTETLNKENTYADIDDFAPSIVASDAEVPTTAGMDPRENTPGISNNYPDSGNQAGEMKAIPVYAEVDANKMDRNKNEIIDERKDAHDAEEGVNDMIVTDNDLYDFNN